MTVWLSVTLKGYVPSLWLCINIFHINVNGIEGVNKSKFAVNQENKIVIIKKYGLVYGIMLICSAC